MKVESERNEKRQKIASTPEGTVPSSSDDTEQTESVEAESERLYGKRRRSAGTLRRLLPVTVIPSRKSRWRLGASGMGSARKLVLPLSLRRAKVDKSHRVSLLFQALCVRDE